MRVGVLEDDLAIQEMLLLVLQDEGYSVLNFPSAEQCLEAFDKAKQLDGASPVDLMIIDWRLNGPMTGIEVIRYLRNTIQLTTLPIILTTAATYPDAEELQDLQVVLLEKPFSVDDMATLIKKIAPSA
jgi:CheY-like chemotaxis protein